jgi:hypothetical protein
MSRTLSVEQLLAEILADPKHPLAGRLTEWISTSKRFRSFAENYRTKIRSKIRQMRDTEGLLDVAFELETAYWLLQENRFTLTYEQPGTRPIRSPDFLVTFTTQSSFGLEVTRMRAVSRASSSTTLAADDANPSPERDQGRLLNIINSKLGQTVTGIPNLLLIGVEAALVDSLDVDAIMIQMKRRADAKDSLLFSRSGLRDAADYFRHYQRLSGVLLRSTQSQAGSNHSSLWLNKEARHPLPTNLQTILKK